MTLDFFGLLGAIAPVFVVIGAGMVMRRVRWLTAQADDTLLRLGINFLFPCLIADTILGNPRMVGAQNVLIPPLLGFAGACAGFLVAALVARLLRLSSPSGRSFTFTAGLQNYGYIPLPVVVALFPRETAGVLFTHNLGVEIALWTVGIWMLSGQGGRAAWRKILNPPICALLVSMLLNALNASAWLPAFATSAIHLIGQSAIPLLLLLTGATLADLLVREQREGLGARPLVLVMANFVRMAAVPLVILAAARWLPLTRELRQVLVVQAAMPSAMMPIILARHYGANSALAVGIVISTTLLGLLTIPAWLRFGLWWVGV